MNAILELSRPLAGNGVHKLQYIDLLRGVAILGVIAIHCDQQMDSVDPLLHALFNYGQLGVQLFFVASAITLCLSMSERHENSPYNFYVRRFFRIAPLYYFGIAFYFLWRVAINYKKTGAALPLPKYSLLGVVENIFFVHGFDPANYNFVVPGGWSIATEMCFYAIFPLLFSAQNKLGYKGFLRLSFGLIFLSFIVQMLVFEVVAPAFGGGEGTSIDYRNDEFGFIYCTILNQISVFLVGILTFQKLKEDKSPSSIQMLSALLLCCLSFFLLNTTEFKTGYNGFFYPVFSAFAFSTFALRLSRCSGFIGWPAKILIKIGQVSFSMYLLHFFILDVVVFVCRRSVFLLIDSSAIQLIFLFLTLVVVTYLFSRISYSSLEKPAIDFGRKFIRR